MSRKVTIEEIKSTEVQLDQLSDLLVQVVEDGASIGFLPPLERAEAQRYWESALSPEVVLWIAKVDDRIAGSVQLHLATKQNGQHRAEIAKLMTHPNFRRMGIGRLLMQQAQERALQEGRTLLVLDTREGDPSNLLYAALGYIEAGRIPGYARSATGEFDASIFYYKVISDSGV